MFLTDTQATTDSLKLISAGRVLTTAMTGGQDSAGTNKFEAICRGLGVSDEHLKVVVPLPKNMAEIKATIEKEINYHGVSVIIPRRECMQTLQRHLKQKKAAK